MYVLDLCLRIEEAFPQCAGQVRSVKGQCISEDETSSEDADDLLPQFLALLGEGSVIDALDQPENDGVALLLPQLAVFKQLL